VADVDAKTRGARRGLEKLGTAIYQAAVSAVAVGVKAAEDSEKRTRLFNDKSGGGVTRAGEGTRGSIKGSAVGLLGFVSAGGAARFLESGTAPHLIVAHGKALRFESAGQVLYRKFVRHPGTRPRPFVSEAREVGAAAMLRGAEEYVSHAIRSAR
jgi:hypothetical protein